MIFIIITAIIIYFILIAWTWQSLGTIEKSKKIAYILIGIILMFVITLIIFQTTKGGINYENAQIKANVQNVLVIIFTGINAIIVMPQIGRMLDKVSEGEIEKDALKKKLIILLIIFIICILIERGYMKSTQEGILEIYNSMK